MLPGAAAGLSFAALFGGYLVYKVKKKKKTRNNCQSNNNDNKRDSLKLILI